MIPTLAPNMTTQEQEQLEKLVKAVWAAGFRAGKESGEDCAWAEEWGKTTTKPQNPKESWEENVQWRFNAESESYKLAINKPENWDFVP